MKQSVKTLGNPAENRTGYLPSRSLEHYSYRNALILILYGDKKWRIQNIGIFPVVDIIMISLSRFP
jgi:hypothetical protein